MKHVSVFDLRRYVRLNGIPETLDTLLAHRTDIWKIFLGQLAHIDLNNLTQRLACIVWRSVCRTTLDVGLTALLVLLVVLPLAVVQFKIFQARTVKQLRCVPDERLVETAFIAIGATSHFTRSNRSGQRMLRLIPLRYNPMVLITLSRAVARLVLPLLLCLYIQIIEVGGHGSCRASSGC